MSDSTVYVITATRGHSRYRHTVVGAVSAMRQKERLASMGWQNVTSIPQTDAKRNVAMLALVFCVIGFVVAVALYGAWVNVCKRAAFEAASVEVAK